MKDLCIGDAVFGSNGKPCTVTAKSAVHNKECYKIVFDDTSEVVCDADHRWKLIDGIVKEARHLLPSNKIAICKPIETSSAELPLDPYVLGFWLADGKHTSAEVTKPDDFIWEEVKRRGYALSNDYARNNDSCRNHTILGIRGILSMLNVLGNKHIPQAYLWASYQQRLDLLRGLMDGDGSRNDIRKQCIFSNTDPKLSKQVLQLLCSLGQRPLINHAMARGFGLEVETFNISFRPQHGIVPFLLPRKAEGINSWGIGQSHRRSIWAVKRVPSVPTQCISVDSPDNTYLCTEKFIPTHNTGKKKVTNQMQLMALLLFAKFPQVNVIHAAFLWLQTRKTTRETFKREQIPMLWEPFVELMREINWCKENNLWLKRQNGLCKAWCPVTECEFNGRFRRG